jgi:hypothetical protein
VNEQAQDQRVCNIFSDAYFRIGDRVKMNADEHEREYGHFAKVPNDTLGTVVGFTHHYVYIGRVGQYGQRPGKHFRNGTAIVMWDNGESCGAGHAVCFAENHQELLATRRDDHTYNQLFTNAGAVVSPLPDLPFYEWDLVSLIDPALARHWGAESVLKVRLISYHMHDEINSSTGKPVPIYDITDLNGERGSQLVRADQIKLISRGNVYKWFNRQYDQMIFASLKDEIEFQMALGMYDEIECPASKNYSWDKQSIIGALEAGEIHLVNADNANILGTSTIFRGISLRDTSIAERARVHSLAAFMETV